MSNKNRIVPRLRFPEFRDAGDWEEKRLGNCLDYIQPTKYLVKSTAYSDNYNTPVLTAGKTFILGYTNELHGIFSDKLPVIIFDDFTTATKFVDFSFKAKSSAIKILMAKKDTSIKFIYESMQTINYEIGAHKRHWISIFAKLNIAIPKPPEQQKIADCLSSLDDLITAQGKKLDGLKTHKKGLMQQMFPAEGETMPKLRFPEFRDVGAWDERKLKSICQLQAGNFVPASEIYNNHDIDLYPCYGGNGLRGYTKSQTHSGRYSLIGRQGALCGNITFADGEFHATEHAVVAMPTKKTVTDWLYYELINLDLNKYATGQAQPGLSVKNLEHILVQIPSPTEQQKIAACLSSLDDLITAQGKKLDGLKTHKKGLMQQMFPASGEVGG